MWGCKAAADFPTHLQPPRPLFTPPIALDASKAFQQVPRHVLDSDSRPGKKSSPRTVPLVSELHSTSSRNRTIPQWPQPCPPLVSLFLHYILVIQFSIPFLQLQAKSLLSRQLVTFLCDVPLSRCSILVPRFALRNYLSPSFLPNPIRNLRINIVHTTPSDPSDLILARAEDLVPLRKTQ